MRVEVDPKQPLDASQELSVLVDPFLRAWALPAGEKFMGALLSLVAATIMHIGFAAVGFLILSSVIDYRLGTAVAYARGEHRIDLAQLGKIGKIAGVALCMFILGIEFWVSLHPEWIDTRGLAAGVLASWLILDDMRSIGRHMKAAGRHVPDWLDAILDLGQRSIDKRARTFMSKHGGPKS